MKIINHTTKDTCKLKYFQYSYFFEDVPHKVTGVITDANGQARWVFTGTWTEKIEGGPVESTAARHAHSHHMKLLWQRKMRPAYLEKMYNITQLAIEFNQEEPGVAPTDSDMHIYTNEYWECEQKQDWSRSEEIFRDRYKDFF